MKYPECEKLKEVSEDSNKIGAFLDWLMYDKGIVLSKEYEGDVPLWRHAHIKNIFTLSFVFSFSVFLSIV